MKDHQHASQFLVKSEDGRRQLYATLAANEMCDDSLTIVIGDVQGVDDVWWKRTLELENADGVVTKSEVKLTIRQLPPKTTTRGGEIPFSLATKEQAYELLDAIRENNVKRLVLLVQSKEQKRYLDTVLSGAPERLKKWEQPAPPELDVYHVDAEWYDYQPQHEDEECLTPIGGGGVDWRAKCKSFGQLSTALPKFLVNGLIPEKCLTAITGHSFNSKSWVAMQLAWSLSQGEQAFQYFDVQEPVPVVYHVPEMHEAQVRYYADVIGIKETENFLFRTMEDGVWLLDSAEMLASSKGRAVVLDTSGFFNPADDGNDYTKALKFGKLVFDLLNAGALGVVMLGHLAKPTQGKNGKASESDWTLENSIIGSAGYGAMLRSLLRVKNINEDLNNHNVHLYVQGMKNPGLKPFQLKGPAPLQMLVEPGKSPYLRQLLSGDAKYMEACMMFGKQAPQREVAKQLGLSLGKVNKLHKQWKDEQEGTEVFQGASDATDIQ